MSIPMETQKARPARAGWLSYGLVLAASLGLFGLACLLPALQLSSSPDSVWPGFALLLMGWLGFLILQFGWLANFPYLVGLALLAFRKPAGAALAALLACLLSLQTFLLYVQTIPHNESSMEGEPLYAMLPGGYLWFAALMVLLAGSTALAVTNRRH